VQADSFSRRFGFPDPQLTYALFSGSLVNGDALSGAVARAPGELVGQYTIAQGSLNNQNYQISYRPGVFTIDPSISALPLGNQSNVAISPSDLKAARWASADNEITEIITPPVNDNDSQPTSSAGCVESDRGVCVVTGS
jgi:MBG domain (YGX type)